ncbi:MAG TPA: zinc-binding dehydrogenase [Acidisphaera sp.]|nr:zinc-binding dehydrogenase [Acidisphaera sp.]
MAHWPALCATPLDRLDDHTAAGLIGFAKLVVSFGGLLRSGLQPGETVIVNGASGYFGSAGVLLALAMGAGRVVAAGGDRDALADVAALDPRVRAACLTGQIDTDVTTLTDAAAGRADRALDLLGRATSTATTLSTLRSLRRGGRLVLMGSAEAPLEITFGEMLSNDWDVVGCFMYPREAPARLASLVASGRLDLSPIRVQVFPLAELPKAIEAAARMRGLDLVAVAQDAP